MRLSIPAGAVLVDIFPPFTLYSVPGGGPGWPQYKLMLPVDTPARHGMTRSYNLTWGVAEQRFRFDRQTAALRRNEPALERELDDLMRALHRSK
jgi:hypothetical protein